MTTEQSPLRTAQSEAAEAVRRLLEAVERGELTVETPEERRNLRRLEGLVAAWEAESEDNKD